MGAVRSKIRVTAPLQGAATVNVYRSNGLTLASAFTTETGLSAHSFPVTVAFSTSTDFWVQNGDYVVSAVVNAVEMAAGYGNTRAVHVDNDGVVLRPESPGGGGSGGGGVSTFAALTDVNVAGQADGDAFTWNSGTGKYVATTVLLPAATYAQAQAVNAQTGTTYTLVAGDAGKLVTLSNASAITMSVPQDSAATIAIGTYVDLYQLGAGQVTVAAGTGATLRVGGLTAKARAQYSRLTVQKVSANSWSLMGDLAAS